jgi:glutamyl-tRNA reductase
VTVPAGELVALVTHARDVRATDRAAFAAHVRDDAAGAGILLETCHRVEAYRVVGPADGDAAAWLPVGGRILRGDAPPAM